jgi:hypothetical protein
MAAHPDVTLGDTEQTPELGLPAAQDGRDPRLAQAMAMLDWLRGGAEKG